MLFASRRVFSIVIAVLFVMGVQPAFGQTTETVKLLPEDGAEYSNFGYSVATEGTLALVGADADDAQGINAGAAYVFDTTTGAQLFKLVADDAAADDWFGVAVAMSDTRAIIGAYNDDAVALNSGSAYIFDLTTGAQIRKFVPSDGEELDHFGVSVAISPTYAAIGSSGDDDNGLRSGSVYLYDPRWGTFQRKLIASDGDISDYFGIRVGMSGTTLIVGAYGDDDNGSLSGSAYLFDASTGAELFKLLPDDGAAEDYFGISVDVSGTTAIVGAHYDDDLGSNSGAAYLFDTTTGEQTFKLLPEDGEAEEFFGVGVGIHGTVAVVGALSSDDPLTGSGTAYFFDTTTGQQIAKLLPSDGGAQDEFGLSVQISATNTIVGAWQDDDTGENSGSAYIFAHTMDTDGDGLWDTWETDGIPLSDGSGTYLLPGADPNHKDLYVEVDALTGQAPPVASLPAVVDAFAAAGINLHIPGQSGDPGIDEIAGDGSASWDLLDNEFQTDFTGDFDTYKAAHFGTVAERADPNWPLIREAKERAYRYCVFIHDFNNVGATGIARSIPGRDFVVSLGHWADHPTLPPANDDETAGTFMHELGHTLGLWHGGKDGISGKPNYHSVMNYVWTVPNRYTTTCANGDVTKLGRYHNSWRLDYSHEALTTLNESQLDESAGLGGASGVWVPIGPPAGDPTTFVDIVEMNGPVNWDRQGDASGTSVAADLNYLPNCISGTSPSAGQTLIGHDDWANLQLAVPSGTALKAAGMVDVHTELTAQMIMALGSIEVDCNANGLEDGQEVIDDPSVDEDGDGVPDECQEALWVTSTPMVPSVGSLLDPAVPNPFNPQTTIGFRVRQPGPVKLAVYDARGREIAVLVDRDMATGTHQAQWDGRDRTGRRVASGLYLYRLRAGSYEESKRMILLK